MTWGRGEAYQPNLFLTDSASRRPASRINPIKSSTLLHPPLLRSYSLAPNNNNFHCKPTTAKGKEEGGAEEKQSACVSVIGGVRQLTLLLLGQ
jgi:hypothetical protein